MKNIVIICPYEGRIPLQVTSYRAFMPRYGMLTVADALKREGYDVKVYCEFSGSRINWQNVYAADVVCFSLMSFASLRGYMFAEKVRAHCDAPIIFGGTHASVLPENCLGYCDYVVRNEGERTIVALLDALKNGGNVTAVKGISYRNAAGKIVHNPDGEFLKKLDLIGDPGCVNGYSKRSIGFYMKDMFLNGVPRFNIAVTQASRGCPLKCTFCFAKNELGNEYRKRDPELVLREIEISMKKLGTKFVFFADNDFALDREHTLAILRLLEQRFHGDLDYFFFTRIFIAKDQELMEAVQRAGRACIGIGIESVEPETLKYFRKPQNLDDIYECLEIFGGYKVKLQLLFVFGADTDNVGSIQKALDLALRFRVYNWGFCSIYDFPTRGKVLGVPQTIPDHRFIHRDWRFYSGNFVVHYPRWIPPSVLQKDMSDAYRKFYGVNRSAFYQYHPIQATYKYYIPFLRKVEDGLYYRDGSLREELLPGPAADMQMLDMHFNRWTLAGELARFYAENLFRAQAWKYLFSLPV